MSEHSGKPDAYFQGVPIFFVRPDTTHSLRLIDLPATVELDELVVPKRVWALVEDAPPRIPREPAD